MKDLLCRLLAFCFTKQRYNALFVCARVNKMFFHESVVYNVIRIVRSLNIYKNENTARVVYVYLNSDMRCTIIFQTDDKKKTKNGVQVLHICNIWYEIRHTKPQRVIMIAPFFWNRFLCWFLLSFNGYIYVNLYCVKTTLWK